MADKLMRAIVSIPMDTGVPEDECVNVWHFDGDDVLDPGPGEYTSGVMTLLTAFYQAIDGLFPAQVASPATVKIYDMRDPEPRVPEHTGTIALTPSATPGYPNEIAIAMSYYAARESGESQARRRGRLFLGPVNNATGSVVSSAIRVNSSTLTTIQGAAAAMVDGTPLASGPGSVKWAVYSPTTYAETGNLDDSFHDVVGGWIDDAFDVQRRRGAAATTRTLFS